MRYNGDVYQLYSFMKIELHFKHSIVTIHEDDDVFKLCTCLLKNRKMVALSTWNGEI